MYTQQKSLPLVDLQLLQELARQWATFGSSAIDWDQLASEANEWESFQMQLAFISF